jgi:hypothetical protein
LDAGAGVPGVGAGAGLEQPDRIRAPANAAMISFFILFLLINVVYEICQETKRISHIRFYLYFIISKDKVNSFQETFSINTYSFPD